MADKDDLTGRQLGEFVLVEPVDEGGFGTAYRCQQPLLGRDVLVKVLHHRLRVQDVQVQRFLREAQLASKLDHPYAAHIYGFGIDEANGLLWIAMEFVHGITLKHWLRDRGPMSLVQFVPFFENLAEVVQTLHERGIVHRDLKPSNIMVIERAGRQLPKLLDLGVAKLRDGERLPESTPDTIKQLRALKRTLALEKVPEEVRKQFRGGASTVTGNSPSSQAGGQGRLTPDHAKIGTPGYMAPEQWLHSASVGPPADLFSLGVVAIEVLTGKQPFVDMPIAEFLDPDRHGKVPPLGDGFPRILDRMFQRALATRPEDRWGTALELAGALREASGIGVTRSDLPQIDRDVRDAWLTEAPQPLAESMAELDAAHNVHQARDIAEELIRTLLRYLLAMALAMSPWADDDHGDPVLLELVRALATRALGIDERVELLRLLVRRLKAPDGDHPMPELLALLTPNPGGTDGLDPLLALYAAMDRAVSEDAVRWQLLRLIPLLTELLRRTTFVLDYVLVVPRNNAAEPWTGRRRQPRAPASVSDGDLVDGRPTLLDPAGRAYVDLWPLVQAVPPGDGAEPELFLFDGHGRHGALLIASPSGLEHHDAITRAWVDKHVIADIEAKTRMRDQIRIGAQQWQDRARANALLWRGEVLAELERWTRHASGAAELSDLEAAFVASSRRAGQRTRRLRLLLLAAPVVLVLAGVAGYSALETREARRQARMTQQLADLSVTQAEVEAGRQALLYENSGDAQLHLSEAYRRGDHSPATKFMLARALQPLHAEQARFAAAAGRMWSAAFSPDGKRVVTTDDKAAQVWDARTNQLLFTLPHGDTVYDARYSSDGGRIFTGSGDGAVRIWDATTGALVRELRHNGTSRRYYATALSPDAKFVAAIDMMGAVVHVWDSASGAPLAELHDDGSGVPVLAFSADGRWLASSGGDAVHVFDVSTWSKALVIAGPHIRTLSFDPTGPRLATGSAGGDASIWELPRGTRTRHLREIGDPVNAIAYSPDGQLVASGGGSGAVQVWQATTGALQSQFNAMPGKILAVEFDPTSQLVVAAGDRGAAVVANAALGMPETTLEGARGVIMTVHFDPSSHRIVGASWDGTARVWDSSSPYRAWNSAPITDECGAMGSVESDGRFLAIGCRDLATRVWDTARGQLLAELPSVTPVAGISAVPAVNAGGDRAVIARGNTVEIYELPGGRLVRTIHHGAPVDTVAFGPAGHDFVSGATDGSLLVTRDDLEPIVLPTSSAGVDAAAILQDGRVVAADARGRLRFYDPAHHTLLVDLEASTRVRMFRLSPDGIRLLTIPKYTGMAAPPLLWDLAHYRLISRLEGHTGRVFSARFTASGVVTVGGDGAARLWERDTGRLLETYHSTSSFLADAVIDPDRAMIIASGSDGLLWFWDLPTGRPLWKLQAHKSHAIGIHLEGDHIVTRGFAGDVTRWAFPRSELVIQATLAK